MRVNHVGEVCAQALYASQALVTRDASLRAHFAQASAEVLDRQLRHDGLFFGERPLCSVLRPRFLSLGQYKQLATA